MRRARGGGHVSVQLAAGAHGGCGAGGKRRQHAWHSRLVRPARPRHRQLRAVGYGTSTTTARPCRASGSAADGFACAGARGTAMASLVREVRPEVTVAMWGRCSCSPAPCRAVAAFRRLDVRADGEGACVRGADYAVCRWRRGLAPGRVDARPCGHVQVARRRARCGGISALHVESTRPSTRVGAEVLRG